MERTTGTIKNWLRAAYLFLFKYAFDPYRPELHYMRGPGPAWHAKYHSHPGEFLS